MERWWSLLPLVVFLAGIVLMACAAVNFSRYRWERLKDVLVRLWSEDRQEILCLQARNGFIILVERLAEWSGRLLKFSWLPALPALALGPAGLASAALLVALACAARSAAFVRVASVKAAMIEGLIEYDHFGTYGRAREDWRQFGEAEARTLKVASMVSLALSIPLAIDLL